jgi:anti-sigma B factor antagonist
MLVVTRTDTPGGVALSAAGEIDCASAPVLVADLDKAIADADGPILIDLGDVTFMDCSGVHALLAARHSAPTRLRLRRLHPAVRRVLELAAVLDVFALTDQLTSR